MDRGQFPRLVRDRRFQRLVAVRVTSTTADGLLQAALTSFVLFSPERQPTPAKILIAFGVLLMPYSVFGPFIGVLIDRWQRQRILVWATILRGASVLVVAGIVAGGHAGSSLAVAVLFALGVGRFVGATLSAALPHVVDEDLLVAANAVAPTAGTLMSIVGGMVGVTISTLLGGSDEASVFIIGTAAAGHLIATVLSTRIPRDQLGPDDRRHRKLFEVLAWLRSGVTHLRQRPRAARAILRVSMHRAAFGGATLLVLMLTRNSFNDNANATHALGQFSFVVAFAGAGAFIGAMLTPPISDRLGIVIWARMVLVGCAVVISASYAFAAAQPHSPTAVAAVLVGSTCIGFAGQCVKISSDTVVQTAVDDSHRGRVFAIYDMALNVGIVGGTAFGAVTIPTSGQSPVFAAALGALLLLAAAIRD
jgi:MFS family permease